jgi:hypothetical protein
VAAPALRTQPIDRRRLSSEDRQNYKPGNRLGAIAKAKAFKRSWATEKQRKPFATEQKPGTGGFTQGISIQQQRLREKGQEKRRAESLRPENAVSSEMYDKLST